MAHLAFGRSARAIGRCDAWHHPASTTQRQGFRLSLGATDLELALAAAREGGGRLPVGGAVRGRLTQALAAGDSNLDLAALAETSRT